MHEIKKSKIVIAGMEALIIVMIVAIIIIEIVTMEEPEYKI
jgi:hypothetical protein